MSHRALFTIVVFLAVANVLVWSLLGVQKTYAQRVYPGIWVETQSLSGLTREQAIDKLKPLNSQITAQKVTLHLADKTYTPTLKELGYTVNAIAMADQAFQVGRGETAQKIVTALMDYQKNKSIPVIYDIDQTVFDAYLNEIGKSVVKEPKNMSLAYENGAITTHPAEKGVSLNKEELRQAIQKQIKPNQVVEITLQYQETNPTIIDESQISEARDKLVKLMSKPLVIQAEEVKEEFAAETIYSFVYFDIVSDKLTVNFDENKVRNAVSRFAKKVDAKATPRQVSAVNNQVISEGQDGRELNAPDAQSRIKQRLESADFESPVVLSVTKIDRKEITISPEFQTGRFPGRYLEIDLSAQRMHLIEGDNYHRTFIISTGSWSHPTPVGTFQILNHIRTAWSNKYKLYMPHWMAIQAENGSYDGYGIHGLPYWPNGAKEGVNHLGRPVSHGCIRLGPGDEDYVYDWAVNGTKVVIHQ